MKENIPHLDFGGYGELLHFAHANAYPPGSYQRFLNQLSRNYRVLAVKYRPLWTDSDPLDLSQWRDIAQDLIHYLDQNAVTGAIGVGHSLGAVTTMMAAVERPDLISSLILIEPVFLAPAVLALLDQQKDVLARSQWPWVATALRRRKSWESRQEAFEHFRTKEVFGRWSDDALWAYVLHGLKKGEDGGYQLTYSPEWEARIYALPPTEVWEIIPQIKQKTLAVRGAHSTTLDPQAWELWKQMQPNAAFLEVPDSGHLLPMERPDYLAQLIVDFCSE